MSYANDLFAALEAGTPQVLLVDDDPNILDTLKDILEEAKYRVHTAANGAQALQALGRRGYNVVVVDFQLPDLTGLELVRKVREHGVETAIILMTGHASLEMAIKAIQESVYDYLVKPVDPEILKKTLAKALEKQRLVLENQALLADLKGVNERLRRLDALKSKMMAVLSHDLRTPLASVRGYSELLRSGAKGRLNEEQKNMLHITMQEADYLNDLIGDLLDLASIEAGDLSLDMKPVSLEGLIQKAISRVEFSGKLKEVDIDVAAVSPLPQVKADPMRVLQVLANFLRSSVKFTPRQGRVLVTAAPKGNMVEVKVSDNGHGLSREALEKVRDLFNRSGGASTSVEAADGIGVGLAIASEIIAAHGGKVGIESEGEGKGLAFWLTLPPVRANGSSHEKTAGISKIEGSTT